jgi:hypothetical protein
MNPRLDLAMAALEAQEHYLPEYLEKITRRVLAAADGPLQGLVDEMMQGENMDAYWAGRLHDLIVSQEQPQ